LLWERRHASPNGFPDYPTALAVDRSDNVIITGTSGGCYTVKYRAADGAVLWEKRDTNVLANAIAVDRAGNVAITGRRGVVSSDYYTAKFAAENGALLWEDIYDIGGENSEANAITVDQDGNVIVTGTSNSDFYAIKLQRSKWRTALGEAFHSH
jgi:outer membrane protein assembly factor BamB